jgi:hypothetical protein
LSEPAAAAAVDVVGGAEFALDTTTRCNDGAVAGVDADGGAASGRGGTTEGAAAAPADCEDVDIAAAAPVDDGGALLCIVAAVGS